MKNYIVKSPAPSTTPLLVEYVRACVAQLQPDGRIAFVEAIREGWCRACGYDLRDGTCHCENDE